MIYSKKLAKFKEISHGFTTRQDGDFELASLGQRMPIGNICLQSKELVSMKQAHGDKIKIIRSLKVIDDTVVFDGFDGLITQEKDIALGVHTADCLPILFYEPVKRIIGACHAGWRGTLLGISRKMIKKIKNLGGEVKNITVAIGPHIGMCCYDTDEERAKLFEEEFGPDPKMISHFEDKPHLDLAYGNFLQLLDTGVNKKNIEVPLFCTSCNRELFFSFRRSKREGDKYGEMLSFIGLRSNETGGHEFSHSTLSRANFYQVH